MDFLSIPESGLPSFCPFCSFLPHRWTYYFYFQTLKKKKIEKIERKNDKNSSLYLFDFGLPLSAPFFVEKLTIPRYFAGDLLQRFSLFFFFSFLSFFLSFCVSKSQEFSIRTPPGSLYRDAWPSLFVGPKVCECIKQYVVVCVCL